MASMLLPALAFLAAINLWTFLAFWLDKRRACANRRRIPERDLLGLAALGGSPCALLARSLFRHKVRKEPFSTRLALIAALQAGALLVLSFA
jgi:uncharacterized membrane protein YsdA (DUF1294 family)